jgi:hypothetical protein
MQIIFIEQAGQEEQVFINTYIRQIRESCQFLPSEKYENDSGIATCL